MKYLAATCLLAAAVATSARADDAVVRRGGEWRVVLKGSNGLNLPTVTQCFKPGRVSDIVAASSRGSCTNLDVHTGGGKIAFDAVCPVGQSKGHLHMVIALAGDTAYHAESRFTYSPPVNGISEMVMTQDAQWLGACPAGETPKD